MSKLDLSNISCQDFCIAYKHPFQMCFDLSDDVANGFTLDTDYTFTVTVCEGNEQYYLQYSGADAINVDATNSVIELLTLSQELCRGQYHYELRPVNATLSNYLTIKGNLEVT